MSQQIKDQITLEWKEFSIDLPSFEKHMRDTYPSYVGNQAASQLELYFDEGLEQEDKDAILASYDALDETEEADKRALPSRKVGQDRSNYLISKKTAAALKLEADRSDVEKKLLFDIPLSNDEVDSLEA